MKRLLSILLLPVAALAAEKKTPTIQNLPPPPRMRAVTWARTGSAPANRKKKAKPKREKRLFQQPTYKLFQDGKEMRIIGLFPRAAGVRRVPRMPQSQ